MERTPSSELSRVQELWDKTAEERIHSPIQGWLDSPLVLESYVQPQVSGSPEINWLVGLAKRHEIPKQGRWLSLGCGSAGLEIFASKQGLFHSLVALDASPASLEVARRDAESQGVANIEFGSADLNRLDLPSSAYDVVLMNMSLHHVKNLRETLSQVRRTLRAPGRFLINEFIGPRQFQFTELQLSIVEQLLATLPTLWRRDIATGGDKTRYARMPVEHWNVADPSEAIRSDRIVPEIERQFHVIERIDYGGTLLNLLLEHIIHNFNPEDPKDVGVIRLLATFESILIRNHVLPSDFTVMVLERRSRALSGLRLRNRR
jgi:ubiquinone/menaquinone biosynthesis C-methylase UbiE